MEQQGQDNEGRSESGAYETRDIKARPLAVFIAGLTVAAIVVYLVVYLIIRLFNAQAARQDSLLTPSGSGQPALTQGERLPPEPRIQVDAAGDLQRLRAGEDAVLTTYGWVDREAGVVRLPVDVAMRLVLQEGLPARGPGDAVGPASRAQTTPAQPPAKLSAPSPAAARVTQKDVR
jgi:hypothetical protein